MTGLILEGGGMRGAFTSGVLDSFIKNNMYFDSVYGVSAGASTGASFISRQFERNKKVFVDMVANHNYFSFKHLFTQRNLLDVRLLFDIYPNKLIPFDYSAFEQSRSKFYTVLTDCISGEPVYIERKGLGREEFMMRVLVGSNSLPLLSPAVEIKGRPHLDGGISDSIPIRKAENDGCAKNIVILTREKGYRKKESGLNGLIKTVYRKWPKMTSRFTNRHIDYNNAVDYCEERETGGHILLIRPESTMDVGRTERNTEKLRMLYEHGFKIAEAYIDRISSFLNSDKI